MSSIGRNPHAQGMCLGFITGVIYMLGDSIICLPPGATHNQAYRMVIRYIDQRLERLREDFRRLAVDALRACGRR
jgi:Rap1a immunity proteins